MVSHTTRWALRGAVAFAALVSTPRLAAAQRIVQGSWVAPVDAKDHLGQRVTVCGAVASARYLATGAKITLLNFDKPYPNQIFTAVIFASTRPLFPYAPEVELLNKQVCVTGTVTVFRDGAQIVVQAPADLVKM